ncbi:hypothetical protein [Streptomyces sp. NPDC090021]|uniref:hypothetical protein n=1 Tax=Streptomyces sp. NPDC090021 TaxID=3365919 RepID=UPI0037F984A4
MRHSLHPSGTPIPRYVQAIVLVVIILLATAVSIAVPTPAVAASTAALVQAGATLWIVLYRLGAPAIEG